MQLELIATDLSLSLLASGTSKFLSNLFQEPFSRGRINHHYGYLDLHRKRFADGHFPVAKRGERARSHNTDRREANLPVLERTLMFVVCGNKHIKQSFPR